MTDGPTDRRTDARGKTICLPTLAGGRHNNFSNNGLLKSNISVKYMSRIMRNVFSGFPTRSDKNWAVQLQEMARGLKFQI